MHSTSVIRGFLIGSLVAIGSLLSLAVVNYSGVMQQLWGTSNITNAAPGQVYFNTDSNTFWCGNSSSNPVKVGTIGVASTNDINTAVGSLASTTFVNSAVAPLASTTFVNNAVASLASTTFVNSAVAPLASTNYVNTSFLTRPLTVLSNANLTVTNESEIATVGTCTITLPTATAGRLVSIVKRDEGTLLLVNGGTIEGDAAGASISVRFSGVFLCDGSKWWVK
jgi:hypothetical protein